MKKVLSLLLVCTMILSLATICVVNAADESYMLSFGNYTITKKANTFVADAMGETDTWYADEDAYLEEADGTTSTRAYIILNVTSTVAASSGSLAIDYDETKVAPMYIDNDGAYPTKLTDEFIVADTVGFTELNNTGSVLSITWSNNGNLPAGDSIAYLQFGLLENIAVEDLNSDTFKLADPSALDDVATDALKGNFATYGSSYMVYDNAPHSTGCTFKYPYWKAGTEAEIVEEVTDYTGSDMSLSFMDKDEKKSTSEGATDLAKIVVFGKNVVSETLKGASYDETTGVVSGDYGVKIDGTTYYGVGDVDGKYWAIILVDQNGSIEVNKTYNYSAFAGNDTWTGTVTAE